MPSNLDRIASALDAIANNRSLWDESQYAERTDILDQLEFPILATLTEYDSSDQQVTILTTHALSIQHELMAINTRLFQRLRDLLCSPSSTPAERLQILSSYRSIEPPDPADDSYDDLDVLIQGILQLEPAPDHAPAQLPAEMVAYQPTPARALFDLITAAQITASDRFYDLGSGLGHVAILVGLLTGASATGIEIDPALCAAARHSATSLQAEMVTMIQADVRSVDLSDGTIFYLYTPFTGSVLSSVLEQLRLVSLQHPIQICTYGPHLVAVESQPWLQRADRASIISIYTSAPRA